MACACKKNKTKMTTDLSNVVVLPPSSLATSSPEPAVIEAKSIGLPQCYLCAKKHVGRAQQFFEEYHTGYDNRVKLLTDSLRVSEHMVRKAFLLRQKTQSQLDMAAGELLGGDETQKLDDKHIEIANKIRKERLGIQDDPLYVPDFDQLLVDIQLLQFTE